MRLPRIVGDCRGKDLAEYAILISLIALALIAAITLMWTKLAAMLSVVAGIL